MKEVFSQIDPRWAKHALGWGPALGTIGGYGCYVSVLASIANDSGHSTNPAQLDDLLTAKRLFLKDPTGTFDSMPDNALDQAFPGDYQTSHYSGFRADLIRQAIPSPDTYVVLWIANSYSPLWKMRILTHFVLGWNAAGTLIGDPEGGVVRPLTNYGGPTAIHQTTLIKAIRRTPVPKPVVQPTLPPPPVAPPPVVAVQPIPVPTPPPIPAPPRSLQDLLVILLRWLLRA